MTGCDAFLSDKEKIMSESNIHLSNGSKTAVTHSGNTMLENGLQLQQVMYAPQFKHNLISVQKLAQHENCKVVFTSTYCMILDNKSSHVRGIGRVERKHRNLLEMSRALRFQSGVPIKYWGDCVQTAAYITNRIPTQVLDGKTPYEVLFNSKPDYAHFKVFGCLAIALNPDKKGDKFKERGIPCVFIGYPQQQKGYKLINLLNNNVFVTRNVTFYEHIFPYIVFKSKKKKSSPLDHLELTLGDELDDGQTNCETEEPNEIVVTDENETEHETDQETIDSVNT
ncbi:Retrovirus-related Pol polyprotein from transposon TNT 1-94 [Bienertia sinuspersici]